MPHVILTQELVDGPLAPGTYFDLALANFAVRVGANRRAFYVRVREGHKRVRVAVGLAGDPATQPGRLRVKAARKRAAELLALHADGVLLKPPADVGVDGLSPDTATVAQLVSSFLAEHTAGWSTSHASNSRCHGNRLVKLHGTVLARSLSRHQLKTAVRTYAAKCPTNANRYHAFLSKLCRWAVNEELLDRNPIDQLGKVTVEESRDRELSSAELVAFWAALDAIAADPASTPRDRAIADVWRLRLLTAQRETPLRKLEWSWVKFDTAVLDFPASVMKGKKGKRLPHVVPLGARALKLLEARRAAAATVDRLVFGTRKGTTAAPGKSRGNPVALPDFQGKDLRRTAATLMAKHGITDFVISRVLAHVRRGDAVTGIYNRYEYLSEKRVALDTLDRLVTEILEPSAASSAPVLPFQRAGQ